MKKPILFLALFSIFYNAGAQVVVPFSPLISVTQKGDITHASNTVLTCSGAGCPAAQTQAPPGSGLPYPTGVNVANNAAWNNNNYTMVYVDQDGGGVVGGINSFSSSNANLTLGTTGGCGVVYAVLTWGGNIAAANGNYAKRDSVYFRVPGGTNYIGLKADSKIDNSSGATTYQCYKDVTNLVKTAGAGTYWAANITASTGAVNFSGGWSLVVVYSDPTLALRNLVINRGYVNITNAAAPAGPQQFDVGGFFTPPSPAPVTIKLGTFSIEGDMGTVGDSLKFRGGGGSGLFEVVYDGLNRQNNYFNSSITNNGSGITRSPSFPNSLGYDADIVTLDNSTKKYLGNSASSATVRLTTAGDQYWVFLLTTAIDVFEPDIRVEKSYNNLSRANNLPALPGDIIEFSITTSNKGSDPADSLVVTDSLYGGAIYVPNSMSITLGANTGGKTDAIGDDQMDFDPVANVIKARLGIGADGINGGKLLNVGANDSIATFRFRVQVANNCEVYRCSDSLYNMAFASYKGQTSQGYRTLYSSAAGTDINGCPLSGAVKVKVDIDPGNCPPPNDTAFTTCSPYNLSNVEAFRPGYNTYYNSSGTQVTQATTTGIYYAVKTIYPGFTWLPACRDTVVLNLNLPCILPIVLVDFKAKYINKKIELTWKTAQEVNNKYFEVERSIDGFSFEKIATIQAAVNSNTTTTYSFEDINYPIKDIIYYRLAYVDINGNKKYTEIRTVKIDQDHNYNLYINYAYPNPVKSTVSFSVNAVQETKSYMRLISMEGKVVVSKTITLRKGDNILPINISNLSNGIYLVEFVDALSGKKTTTKIIKQ